MNIAQKSLGVLLGFGLPALPGNSMLANGPDTTTKNASVPRSVSQFRKRHGPKCICTHIRTGGR